MLIWQYSLADYISTLWIEFQTIYENSHQIQTILWKIISNYKLRWKTLKRGNRLRHIILVSLFSSSYTFQMCLRTYSLMPQINQRKKKGTNFAELFWCLFSPPPTPPYFLLPREQLCKDLWFPMTCGQCIVWLHLWSALFPNCCLHCNNLWTNSGRSMLSGKIIILKISSFLN